MPAKFKVVDLPPEADADLSVRAHNQHSEPLHTWESPDWSILDDRRGDLPSFPGDCLGKAFTVVHRAAKGAGVTDAHVAVPMLGIATSARKFRSCGVHMILKLRRRGRRGRRGSSQSRTRSRPALPHPTCQRRPRTRASSLLPGSTSLTGRSSAW